MSSLKGLTLMLNRITKTSLTVMVRLVCICAVGRGAVCSKHRGIPPSAEGGKGYAPLTAQTFEKV